MYLAYKTLQRVFYQPTRDMSCGIGEVHGMLAVVAGSGCPEFERGCIFLCVCLELFYHLGLAPGTDDEDTGGKRVEGSGMSGLYTLHPEMTGYEISHTRQCPETGHAIGFVDTDYFALGEIHIPESYDRINVTAPAMAQ